MDVIQHYVTHNHVCLVRVAKYIATIRILYIDFDYEYRKRCKLLSDVWET